MSCMGATSAYTRAMLSPSSGVIIAGSYELQARIGEGGSGMVYRAVDRESGRELAIKLLRPQYAMHAQSRGRFLREARLGSALEHPNAVRVFDFGEHDGNLYLAMELLHGDTLRIHLNRVHAMDTDAAAKIGVQIAAALEAAHRLQLVHRDIKPQNIFLCHRDEGPLGDQGGGDQGDSNKGGGSGGTMDGFMDAGRDRGLESPLVDAQQADTVESHRQRLPAKRGQGLAAVSTQHLPSNRLWAGPLIDTWVKVLDFGLAFVVDTKGSLGRLTTGGIFSGTPLYMSPEQAHSYDVGAASDIYALGCVLYEMVAGYPPFQGNFAELATQHLHVPPMPLAELGLKTPIPAVFDDLISSMLAKEAGDRPDSGEVVAVLRGILQMGDTQSAALAMAGEDGGGAAAAGSDQAANAPAEVEERVKVAIVGPHADALVLGLRVNQLEPIVLPGPVERAEVAFAAEVGPGDIAPLRMRVPSELDIVASIPAKSRVPMAEYVRAGFAAVVNEPVEISELSRVLRRLARKYRARRRVQIG